MCTYIYIYICIGIYIYMYRCVYIYVYIYIYTHTHTYKCHDPDILGFSKTFLLRGSWGLSFASLFFHQMKGSGGASKVMRQFHCSRSINGKRILMGITGLMEPGLALPEGIVDLIQPLLLA